jgi:hypothetical protein
VVTLRTHVEFDARILRLERVESHRCQRLCGI